MSLLIVHRDPYMADELRDWAASLQHRWAVPFRVCSDMESARRDLDDLGPPTALVTEADLRDGGRYAGLALARGMRNRWNIGTAIPVVLVSQSLDRGLSNAIIGLDDCMIVEEGGDLERDYRYALRRMLRLQDAAGQVMPPAPNPRYNIHIRVGAKGDCSFEVRSFNTAVPTKQELRFGIKPKRLQKLMALIPTDPVGSDWIEQYREIGADLMRALFREQADVIQELGRLSGLVMAAPTYTRIGLCFSVDRAFYRLPFEALRKPVPGNDFRYWMEDEPLWRRLPEYKLGRPPLFSDDSTEPLNCLLINANCGGDAAVTDERSPTGITTCPLELLSHADDEIDSILETLLNAMPTKVANVAYIWMHEGKVFTRIWGALHQNQEQQHGPFDQVLEGLLDVAPWHLVHFCGHSLSIGREGEERGYVFVPEAGARPHNPPTPKVLGIVGIAAWLKEARFVFLSGCSSSHRDFSYHLCARNVPAMSGYPWPVFEGIAWQHSAKFYRRLLETRSIETALQASWLDMYAVHSNLWARTSSQFVIQHAF